MIKILCSIISLFYLCTATVNAGAFYIAPSISYDGFRTQSVEFIGFTPRLAVGYGGPFNELVYLAAEIFANPKPITKHNYSNITGNLQPSYTYGLSVLPAIILDDLVMAYGRLSILQTRFSYYDVRRTGYQAGAGLEVFFSDIWTVRGEYAYTRYQTLDNLGKPDLDEFTLALVYRFL